MPPVGIVAALALEARIVHRAADAAGVSARVRIACCGMGAERATVAAESLVDEGACLLMSVGYAGALAERLVPGDLLLATGARWEDDADVIACDAALGERAVAALPRGVAVKRGLQLSAAAPVHGRAARAALAHRSGALAADMESAAVGTTARRRGVPWLVLRAISDAGEQRLPASVQAALDAHGRVRVRPLAGALLRRPADALSLPGLARGAARASVSLERALRALLPALVDWDAP